MTITETETRSDLADEADIPLGTLLVQSARGHRDQVATRALVEEETILQRISVRSALMVTEDGRSTCRWEALAGRTYSLGLDDAERAFLGLVLSVVGIGHVTIAAAQDLDERRLKILLRAIVQLSGNDRIAVGTRL